MSLLHDFGDDLVEEAVAVDNYQLPHGVAPPGEWADHGLCRSHPNPDLWFPARGESTEGAKAVCRVCPVQQECLTYAITTGEKFGIWGGTSARERRRMLRVTRHTRRGTAA